MHGPLHAAPQRLELSGAPHAMAPGGEGRSHLSPQLTGGQAPIGAGYAVVSAQALGAHPSFIPY